MKKSKVAIVSPGDRAARDSATFEGHRLNGVAEALRAAGAEPVLAIYSDDFAEGVRAQLLGVDGVLVWVNPIEQGRDRKVLDAVLREVFDAGVLVSAHPDIILAMGTKEVLVRTREMSWGSDTYLYATSEELQEQLPRRLSEGMPRVLKQYRGNGGNGVWKVERHPSDPALIRVRHALRGSFEEMMPVEEFLARCEVYFAGDGRMIDQPFQERLAEGMVRCYMVGDRVGGFGHQQINALYPAPAGASPSDTPQPGPRLYHPPTAPPFQDVRRKMEQEWLPALCDTLGIERRNLPVVWDADFLLGPRTETGEDTYVLCEINVSSVFPFPNEVLDPLARLTVERISGTTQ